jgi:hypothetical protein
METRRGEVVLVVVCCSAEVVTGGDEGTGKLTTGGVVWKVGTCIGRTSDETAAGTVTGIRVCSAGVDDTGGPTAGLGDIIVAACVGVGVGVGVGAVIGIGLGAGVSIGVGVDIVIGVGAGVGVGGAGEVGCGAFPLGV